MAALEHAVVPQEEGEELPLLEEEVALLVEVVLSTLLVAWLVLEGRAGGVSRFALAHRPRSPKSQPSLKFVSQMENFG